MTIDGIILSSLVYELRQKLVNGRIQKINQINKNLVIFNIYSDKNHKLLISIDSQAPRIHITEKNFTNPLTPSNFTMVLRKHLNNSKILDIIQHGLDRTVEIVIESRNELGESVQRKLVVDLMGKHSNLVLIDENHRVIEALKRVSHDMSRVRAVYPGSIFNNIDSNKINIFQELKDPTSLDIDNNTSIFKIFYMNYEGFSPIIGREISYRANLDPKRNYGSLTFQEKVQLKDAFLQLGQMILKKQFLPNLIFIEKKLYSFYCFKLLSLGEDLVIKDSISKVVDDYYLINTNDDSLKQSKINLLDNLEKIIGKKSNKIDNLYADFEKTQSYDLYRLEGEILAANIYQLRRGLKSISLLNYYDNSTITISLDERKDGWQNVERKYKISKKLKKSNSLLKKHIPILKDEISYLQDIVRQIDAVENLEELGEIKLELHEQGYLKSTVKKKKKKEEHASKPLKYETKDGSLIFVGKNNKQNEQLTLRDASKNDLFFHVKDLPGSHVILKNDSNTFSSDDIHLAALLAAKNSKYAQEDYLDVDYTQRKNVFKNKAAKPGMVYYTDFKTIRVKLDSNICEKLKRL
ncbi:MAG: NFACT RNA binding domain-containing protein [Tissierellia bacterium]|nr:NFACT RNA binding domain-containing protein [Tissierellia bacterium]